MNHQPITTARRPAGGNPSDLLLILAVIFPAAGLLALWYGAWALLTGLLVVIFTLLEVGRLEAARLIPTAARYFVCAALAGAFTMFIGEQRFPWFHFEEHGESIFLTVAGSAILGRRAPWTVHVLFAVLWLAFASVVEKSDVPTGFWTLHLYPLFAALALAYFVSRRPASFIVAYASTLKRSARGWLLLLAFVLILGLCWFLSGPRVWLLQTTYPGWHANQGADPPWLIFLRWAMVPVAAILGCGAIASLLTAAALFFRFRMHFAIGGALAALPMVFAYVVFYSQTFLILLVSALAGLFFPFAYWGLQRAGRLDRLGVGAALTLGIVFAPLATSFPWQEAFNFTRTWMPLLAAIALGLLSGGIIAGVYYAGRRLWQTCTRGKTIENG